MNQQSNSFQIISFFRFMRLFNITMFSLLNIDQEKIYALIAWREDCKAGIPKLEDAQKVCWEIKPELKINDALLIGELAYESGWIYSDKLRIEKNKIQDYTGWTIERISTAVDSLLKLRVHMIDEEEITDNFFLHLE